MKRRWYETLKVWRPSSEANLAEIAWGASTSIPPRFVVARPSLFMLDAFR